MGKLLEEAIRSSANNYPTPIQDPNTSDIFWIAQGLKDHLSQTSKYKVPKRKKGLTIVNCVEDNLIKGILVRSLSIEEVVNRTNNLAKCLRHKNLLFFGETEAVLVALLTWHGCMNMAKMTRIVDAGGNAYDENMRKKFYKKLESEWEEGEKVGFPWVKYGVSLARSLSKQRENDTETDWIEKNSPYFR